MAQFPTILCGSEEHRRFVGLSVLLFLAVVIPFLGCMLWASCRPTLARSHQKADSAAHHVETFRFTLYRLRPQVPWWGCVFLVRQTLLAFAPMVEPDDPSSEVVYIIVILLVYTGAMGFYAPWCTMEHNLLDLVSTSIILVLLASNAALMRPSNLVSQHRRFQLALLGMLCVLFGAFSIYTVVFFVRRGVTGDFGLTVPHTARQREQLAQAWGELSTRWVALSPEHLQALFGGLHQSDRAHCLAIVEAMSVSFESYIDGHAASERFFTHSRPTLTTQEPSEHPTEVACSGVAHGGEACTLEKHFADADAWELGDIGEQGMDRRAIAASGCSLPGREPWQLPPAAPAAWMSQVEDPDAHS